MKHSKETKKYIKGIREYLIKTYGSISPEWELMIDLLADNVEEYNMVMNSIEQNGIYSSVSGLKNPLLSTAKDLQASIFKQVQHLGISPYAKSKIKQIEEDTTDDFIDKLTGGE